jgi:ketopantoate hydroxymethyltransferase
VLIIHDLLGLTPFRLKFVKPYQHYRDLTLHAIEAYVRDVERGLFPDDDTVFPMDENERVSVETWTQQWRSRAGHVSDS